MFSKESVRKSLPLIRRAVVASQRLNSRPLFSRSQASTSSPSSSSSSLSSFGVKSSALNRFSRSVSSGCFVVGSGLGIFYYSSVSHDENSFLSFAEYSNETTLEANEDDDRFQRSEPQEKKQLFLFGDGYRRRVFFKYEKRIRMQSPPEKIFEYFASVRTPTGEVFMTPADLMRAVVPVFPPSESNRVREGFLRGERMPGDLRCAPSRFFKLFDTNNDGLISFGEYIFLVTILGIPESRFSVAFKMFDLDNNGEIDGDEFNKVMSLMRKQNRQGARYKDGQPHGPKAMSIENGGLVEYFFGNDGKACLRHERFVQFLRDLHNEILKLEFSHYDHKSHGTISAKDFALSLVASADISHINKLLDRVDGIQTKPHLADIRVTFEEFRDFAELRKKLESFSLAIFSYGKVNGTLTKTDFQRAASQVCGVPITDNVVDIIFVVFDSDSDGTLSMNEFVRAVQRKEGEISGDGDRGLLCCLFNCARNCSSTKLRF